jgi:hypothetical protein
MRRTLRYSAVIMAGFLFNVSAFSQDRFAYLVSDIQKNTPGWTSLRKLDLRTGTFSDILFNGIQNNQAAYDATTKKLLQPAATDNFGNYTQPAFSTGVAAIAYDRRNNRIYFTPMFVDQLRYIDLKTMKVFYITDKTFTGLGSMHNDEAKIVTRMVIGDDGYGYAITNDANNLIRFSTDKNPKIENLGTLVDDPSNTGISVHNKCSSWGGDMVADDEGNLYLFSAHNMVFRISTATKIATWLGAVKNIPPAFTINGAVVLEDGKIMVGSQVYNDGWFVIDPKTWTAEPYAAKESVYLTSDLANSNVIKTHTTKTTEVPTLMVQKINPVREILLYPNPVTTNQFRIQFATPGEYMVQLSDVSGKMIQNQKVSITSEGQLQSIYVNRFAAKGIYLVKVADMSGKAVFTQKLVVQ